MANDPAAFSGKRPLIIRRRRPGDSLIAMLRALGANPMELPVMRMASPDEVSRASSDQVFAELSRFSMAVFTSPYAAERVLAELRKRHLTIPTSCRCLAVGQATAAVLRAHGHEVMAPGRDMTSEGVLKLSSLLSLEDEIIVIFRGEGGRRVMDQEFAARGATVISCPLYRREPDPTHRQVLLEAIRDDAFDVVVAHSGELLDNLAAELPGNVLTQLLSHSVVVPHSRVADKARDLGAQRVEVADNASSDAIVSALARCYS